MRQTKHVFPAFTFYDRTGIQNYLEKQAAKGWMLEKMGGFSWKFRRMEPKKIHFAVTYFPKASAFDPVPGEQREIFREFCAHSGWKMAASSAQLEVYYNEQENPVPIETDPVIELENIHKAARKTWLPTYWMLLPVALVQWMNVAIQWSYDPLEMLSNHIYLFNILCGAVLLLMCGTELFGYYIWYRKAKRTAVEDGEFVRTKGRRTFQIVLLVIECAALILLCASFADLRMNILLVGSLLLVIVICAVSVGATKLMKQMKLSAQVNSVVTVILMVLLAVGGVSFGIVGLVSGIDRWLPEDENVKTYEWQGKTRKLYQDDIPLKIQDMLEVDADIYSYAWSNEEESLLLGVYEAYQRPRYDLLDQPDLEYTIVEVKADFLYDFCLTEMLDTGDEPDMYNETGKTYFDEYRQADASPWGAEAAYELYYGTNFRNEYVLCYGNKIIHLEPDWEMTEEQKVIVGEIFG